MRAAFSTRTIVAIVMVCHFVAAFAALGMPPFFALILEKSLESDARFLAGWFYVVPTLFAALSSPWWGRLADRYGKKRLLIRAQLGLAASFLLAGFAPDAWIFLLALILQGMLGGTFAASNAYLATVVSGPALTRSLTAMQGSARAALVVAPVCLGVWLGIASPIELYRYLAPLPLAAALLLGALPETPASKKSVPERATVEVIAEAAPAQIYALQFLFVFATVATFPYFVSHVQLRFPSLSASWAGLLFGLPHLVYLATAPLLSRWLGTRRLLATLGVAFVVLIASLAGQAQPVSLVGLIAWRFVMGLAMTAGFISLHASIAGVASGANAGRTFGWFESSSKWGAVGAGLCAGVAAGISGPASPFLIGATAMALASGYVVLIVFSRSPLSNP